MSDIDDAMGRHPAGTRLPTPADIPVGHVVRVRMGRHVYSSTVMPAAEAETSADALAGSVADARHRDGGLVRWKCAEGRIVRLFARAVSAVESGPPPALQDRPRDWSGDVHVHLGGSESASESPAPAPTPALLAARPRGRQ